MRAHFVVVEYARDRGTLFSRTRSLGPAVREHRGGWRCEAGDVTVPAADVVVIPAREGERRVQLFARVAVALEGQFEPAPARTLYLVPRAAREHHVAQGG